MAPCQLCNSISLHELPEFPPSLVNPESKWDYIHTFVNNTREGLSKPPGWPFHDSLEGLRASAANCELCHLILIQVDLFIVEFRIAEQDEFFRQTFNNGYPTLKLWLTKRRGGGDGFWVVSTGRERDRDRESVFLLAAVGVCADEAGAVPGLPADDGLSRAKILRLAQEWVASCDQQHPRCRVESSHMPTRVIYVGEEGEDGNVLRLHEPTGGLGEHYIALSHSWGRSKLPITTKATLLQRKARIAFEELSATFKDAVVVTRALGIKYLWIDSLCICQDDAADWEREAAKMCTVYSNAYMTISATGAKDGTIGCFGAVRPRPVTRIAPLGRRDGIRDVLAFVAPLTMEAHRSEYITLTSEPLSDRAWCFQERVLSRRILHFAQAQMYFECMHGFRGEDGLQLPDRYYSIHSSTADSSVMYLPGRGHSSADGHLSQWNELLWGYGPRKLTKGSDKLPALSGIAAAFAEKMNDRYVAGLWGKSLIEGLLWQGLELRAAHEYRAPSWSWASVDGIPGTGLGGRWEPLATILGHHVELKGENPYGEVSSGWVRLEAPLLPLSIVDDEELAPFLGGESSDVLLMRTARSSLPGSLPLFDLIGFEKASAALVRTLRVFALVLALDKDEAAEPCPYYRSLLVTPANEGDTPTMKRIGIILQEADTMVSEEIAASRTVVTLI